MKKKLKSYSELEKISRRAMENQLVSHRIEGIKFSKREAGKIRQEVLQEYVNSASLSVE